MRWVWMVGGGLVLTFGLMALIGSMLPVKHHVTRKARFHAAPEALYAVLAGPPDWRADVKAYGSLPDQNGHKTWWEQDAYGKKVRFELVEDQPPARRVVRIASQGLPFGGSWTFQIIPAAGGADVRIQEDGEIYNVIFRFMSRFVLGYYGSIEGFLRDLAAKLGEPVRIEG